MKKISEEIILNLFKNCSDVLIISHTRPDGDTIGSSLALKQILTNLGKKADVTCDSLIPEKYLFLQGAENYVLCKDVNKKYSLYVFMDCASLGQTGEGCVFLSSKNVTLNIDHHISNDGYAKHNYVCNYASCCEVLYSIVKKLNLPLDEYTANCLLLGMVTDTGNFSHNNTTSQTLNYSAELMEKGANLYKINQEMFKNQSPERSKLFLKIMSGMKFYHEGKLAIIKISKADLQAFNLDTSVTEGFIDYPMGIKGVEIGVSIMETKDKCYKISFRSRGKADVNKLASTFGGGGHVCASGAMLHGYLEDVEEKLVYTSGLYLED